MTAYAFGVVVGAPLITPLLSGIRKKKALTVLMLLFTAGNLWCALAGDISTLIAARVLTAFAHASFFGIGSVYAAELSPPARKAGAVSALFLGATVANIVGVPLGTWIGQVLGWRAAFYAVSATGILSIFMVLAFVPDISPSSEKKRAFRLEIAEIFSPTMLICLLITTLGFSGVFTVFTYIAPILEKVTGLPEAWMSPILFLFGAGMMAGNQMGGKLSDKDNRKALLLSLTSLLAVLVTLPVTLHYLPAACLSVFLLGFVMFLTIPALQVQALNSCAGAKDMAASCNIAAFNLGNAAGAWAGGILFSHGMSLDKIPLAGAVMTLTGLLRAIAKKQR